MPSRSVQILFKAFWLFFPHFSLWKLKCEKGDVIILFFSDLVNILCVIIDEFFDSFSLNCLVPLSGQKLAFSLVFSDCFNVSEKLWNGLLLHNSLLRGNFCRNEICIFLCLLCKQPVPASSPLAFRHHTCRPSHALAHLTTPPSTS